MYAVIILCFQHLFFLDPNGSLPSMVCVCVGGGGGEIVSVHNSWNQNLEKGRILT